VHYTIKGKNIKESQVKRAVDLSLEKYCSATIMLGKTADISHDYEIIEVE
jgi:putative redox protein